MNQDEQVPSDHANLDAFHLAEITWFSGEPEPDHIHGRGLARNQIDPGCFAKARTATVGGYDKVGADFMDFALFFVAEADDASVFFDQFLCIRFHFDLEGRKVLSFRNHGVEEIRLGHDRDVGELAFHPVKVPHDDRLA
jgi:hypothetical protein